MACGDVGCLGVVGICLSVLDTWCWRKLLLYLERKNHILGAYIGYPLVLRCPSFDGDGNEYQRGNARPGNEKALQGFTQYRMACVTGESNGECQHFQEHLGHRRGTGRRGIGDTSGLRHHWWLEIFTKGEGSTNMGPHNNRNPGKHLFCCYSYFSLYLLEPVTTSFPIRACSEQSLLIFHSLWNPNPPETIFEIQTFTRYKKKPKQDRKVHELKHSDGWAF